MIQELDIVALTHDIEEHSLKQGDVGAVVHCYDDHQVYEVEFTTAQGKTIALLTLAQSDIRPMGNTDILHVREFSSI